MRTPPPPCAAHPDDWDMDVGTPDGWQRAVTACRGCPLLTRCAGQAAALTARGQVPRSMIWAGVGYDSAGRIVHDLARYFAYGRDHPRCRRACRAGTGIVRVGEPHPASRFAVQVRSGATGPRVIVIGKRTDPQSSNQRDSTR
ncbi:MAG: hypothetical protein HOQ24_08920 [Mycobacteriaceae bacterium]|nr:hypothetical protein [Mycobacteriaceae bacterium]